METEAQLKQPTSEFSRQERIEPGKLVAPKRPENVLHSGASLYDFAVVVSVEPFTLVSEFGDMMWQTKRSDDFRVVGEATPEMTKAVKERLQLEAEEGVRYEALDLVRRAREAGVVLTITQEPLWPLAMGHYDSVVNVRADRRQ